METKKILVTGGAGFMGSWLVDELITRGHDVVNVDNLSGGYMRNVNSKCKFVHLDLRTDKKLLDGIFQDGIDIVYHLAAYAAEGQSIFSPIEITNIITAPMNNLLVEAINYDVKKFVFTSSMAVYGSQSPPFDEMMDREPEDPYGTAKMYCERILEIFGEKYGLNYTIIRPHNVYGPRQNTADPFRNVLGIWINRILRGLPPYIYGDGTQTRAFSYIEDITPALANAGFNENTDGEIINLGSEPEFAVSINEACAIVLGLAGSHDMSPIYQPARVIDVKNAYSTAEKSKQLLGYTTTHTLEQGLAKMITWAREIGPQEPTYTVPLEIVKKAPKIWLEKAM